MDRIIRTEQKESLHCRWGCVSGSREQWKRSLLPSSLTPLSVSSVFFFSFAPPLTLKPKNQTQLETLNLSRKSDPGAASWGGGWHEKSGLISSLPVGQFMWSDGSSRAPASTQHAAVFLDSECSRKGNNSLSAWLSQNDKLNYLFSLFFFWKLN